MRRLRILLLLGALPLASALAETPTWGALDLLDAHIQPGSTARLNRYFPGRPRGNTAARMAHGFFHDVVSHCERLVDLHTGSFKRTNLPQLRANLRDPAVREFVTHFGATAVLHIGRNRDTLRDAATAAGIPAVTLELGAPATVQIEHVRYGVKAIATLLERLDMHDHAPSWAAAQPIYYRARWLRAVHGGILNSSVALGAEVRAGQALGKVVNPLTNEAHAIVAPHAGRVLGRALNQFVMPGVALFHLGIAATPEELDAWCRSLPVTNVASVGAASAANQR